MKSHTKTNNLVLDKYLDYKRTSVSSERKLKDIERYIKKFLVYCDKDATRINEEDLIGFINNVLKGYKTRTKNDIKVFIKGFIVWNYGDYSLRFKNLNKLCRSETASATYQPEQYLNKEELEKLVQGESQIKWKAYFLTLFYGGFRPLEVCQLKWKDITFDDEGAFIKIYSKKNKTYFDKFVPSNVSFYLNKLKDNNSEYVFNSPTKKKDKPMTESAVYLRLVNLSQRVFNKKINPYLLRHSVATILYNDNSITDKRDVARQMGHSLKMRQTYDNPTKEVIKRKLKNLYLKAEELPPEKKQELENKINILSKVVMELLREKIKSKDDSKHEELIKELAVLASYAAITSEGKEEKNKLEPESVEEMLKGFQN